MNLYLRPSDNYCFMIPGCVSPVENAFQTKYPGTVFYIDDILINPDLIKKIKYIVALDDVSVVRMGNAFWKQVQFNMIPVYASVHTSKLIWSIAAGVSFMPVLDVQDHVEACWCNSMFLPQYRVDVCSMVTAVKMNSYIHDKVFVFNTVPVEAELPDNVIRFTPGGLSLCGEYATVKWKGFISLIDRLPEISIGKTKLDIYVSVDLVEADQVKHIVEKFIKTMGDVKKSYKIRLFFSMATYMVPVTDLLKFKMLGVTVWVSDSFKHGARQKFLYAFENLCLKNDAPIINKTEMFDVGSEVTR